MPQSLMQIYLHLVWSTKHRTPFLTDPLLRDEMQKYLGGACNAMECPVLQVGGVEDHVHILCRPGKSQTVPQLLGELKRESSKWQSNVIHHCEISIGRMVTERFP